MGTPKLKVLGISPVSIESADDILLTHVQEMDIALSVLSANIVDALQRLTEVFEDVF